MTQTGNQESYNNTWFDENAIIMIESMQFENINCTNFSLNYEISKRAEELLQDDILTEIACKTLIEVQEILTTSGKKHRIRINTHVDIELQDWEEIVFSIYIDEQQFIKRIEIWDSILNKFSSVVEEMKNEHKINQDYSERISRIIAIEVNRL